MTPASGAAIGTACAKSTDCGERLCLNPKSYPQGYCSKACGGDILTEGEPCPNGATCVQLNEAAAFCLALCQSSSDCRAGYICGSNGQVKACVPKCKSDAECDQGEACNTTSGFCEKAATASAGKIGAPCTTDAQCASNLCLDPTGSVFPGGYCMGTCTKADVGKPCGQTGVCIDISSNMKEGYACLAACQTGTSCRKEYLCSVDADPTLTTGFCVPRCDHYACDMGETCDTSVGVCVEGAPMMSTGSSVTRVDNGTKPTGPESTDFPLITVDVPADAVSFSIITQATTDKTVLVGPAQIKDPKGKVIFDFNDPSSVEYKAHLVDFLPGGGGMLYPNSPRLPLIPGKYEILFGSTRNTQVKYDTLIKRQSGVVAGGSLPVVVWFTKNAILNAATAQTNAAFQEGLRICGEIYKSIGITLGPYTYKDMTGPNAEKWAVIDQIEQLGDLFANSNESPERALHLFMIDQFAWEGGATVLGISGGIPGPPAYPGLRHGGVAVALSYLDKGGKTSVFGETIAHEGGHFLGLFHTSERDGSAFDPLLDTPQCGPENDDNNDDLIDASECDTFDAHNLMFWSAAPFPQRMLSNDQRFVLLRNPAVQ
jgi:hypothetical protein